MVKPNSFPILVTGSHRSGSTWVGKVLSKSDNTLYVSEPFQPNGLLRKAYPQQVWFKYYTPNEKDDFLDHLKRINSLGYTVPEALHLINKLPNTDFRNPSGIFSNHFNYRNTPWRFRFYRDTVIRRIYNRQVVPIIKDPVAIFSCEWMAKNLNTRNIILIRHPAAFVSSLKRMGWHFSFTNFLQQKNLMSDYLYPYENEMINVSNDIISTGALLWNCFHSVIHQFQLKFPDWLYMKHEELSKHPHENFKNLCKYSGLDYNNKIQSYVNETTLGSNADVPNKKIHQFVRDSKSSIKNWKNRLTKNEINQIRKLTEEVSSHFYSDDDWD